MKEQDKNNDGLSNPLFNHLPPEILKAIVEMYPELLNKLAGFIIRQGGDKSEAADVLNYAFEQVAILTLKEKNFDKMNVPFVLASAKNRWLALKKKIKHTESLDDGRVQLAVAEEDEDEQEKNDKEVALNQILGSKGWLDSKCYRAIIGKYWTKKRCKDMAIEEKIDPNAMRQRLHKCQDKLKREAKRLYPTLFAD